MVERAVVVDEWSNSQAYLEEISGVEKKYLLASEMDDFESMRNNIRNLYSLLKRMRKTSKTRNSELFEKGNDAYILSRISEADKLFQKSLGSDRGSFLFRKKRMSQRSKSLELLRDCFEDLGDFQIANNLTFKEGIDPNDAWAEG